MTGIHDLHFSFFVSFEKKEEEEVEPKKFICVSFHKSRAKWRAEIRHEKKYYYCGYFFTELEAAQAVNAKCVELNIPLRNPEAGLPENKSQVRASYVLLP